MSEAVKNEEGALLQVGQLLSPQNQAVIYAAGARFFEAGEPGDFAYLIDSGYVEISTKADGVKQIVAILGPGEIFGEMALLDGQPRSATATAMHETIVMPISHSQLINEVFQGSPVTRLIVFSVINRLRKSLPKEQQNIEKIKSSVHPIPSENLDMVAARTTASDQLKLRFEMEKAIRKEEFTLFYQPIVCLADGRTAGYESLVRWPRSDGQMYPPDKFIPLAEQSGLIVALGEWILKTALQALATIESRSVKRSDTVGQVFMSINVSPRQLECEENVERLVSIIEESGVNTANVKIEITEQALLLDPRMATLALARLKSTGVRLAIDDFGTGYSSLNYLHRFPLDTLKIDRAFIDGIVHDQDRQRIVIAIVGLAHDLGMDVVAEGVEELVDARWLRTQHCKYMQGYLVAKPLAFQEAIKFLSRTVEM